MTVEVRRGICRVVVLVGPWAVKMPTTRPYGRRTNRLWAWTRGVQANLSEREWAGSGGVAPVLASLAGVVQVYPRCTPVDPADWTDAIPDSRWRAIAPDVPFADRKAANLGLLDGRVVWLDYDGSWNGCPHAPRGVHPWGDD